MCLYKVFTVQDMLIQFIHFRKCVHTRSYYKLAQGENNIFYGLLAIKKIREGESCSRMALLKKQFQSLFLFFVQGVFHKDPKSNLTLSWT